MQWEFIVALVIAIPAILFPAAFVWYLNIGSIITIAKEAHARRATRRKTTGIAAESRQDGRPRVSPV